MEKVKSDKILGKIHITKKLVKQISLYKIQYI